MNIGSVLLLVAGVFQRSFSGHFYAMGWEVGEYEGLNAIFHRGDVSNFQSNTILLPEHMIGLIILVNMYSTFNNQQISHLAWDAAHILVGQESVALPGEPMMYVVIGIVVTTVLFTILLFGWAARILRSERNGKHWVRMVAPAFLLLGIALFNLVVFSQLFETPIPGMLLFAPELAWPVVISGGAAAAGAVVFPILLLSSARAARSVSKA